MPVIPKDVTDSRQAGTGTSYPQENKHPVLAPHEEIRVENSGVESPLPGEPELYDDMPSEQEIEETLSTVNRRVTNIMPAEEKLTPEGLVKFPPTVNSALNEDLKASHSDNNMGNLVKWLVTDPKKAKKDASRRNAAGSSSIVTPTIADVKNALITSPAGMRQEPVVDSKSAAQQSDTLSLPVSGQAELASAYVINTSAGKPVSKKGGIAGFIDKQLDSFGESVIEQRKKDKSDAARKADRRMELVNWFLGKKPESAKSDNTSLQVTGNSTGQAADKKTKNKGLMSFGSGKAKEKDDLPPFEVGKISQPTLDGPLVETDLTYAVFPPFIYVRIYFNGEEIVYQVLEPPLGEGQKKRLEQIEKNLEKLISSKIVAIKPEEREQFLRQKFEDIIRMYNWNLTEAYKDRMFFYLRKKYLGYDKIEVLMKDHYIEDISCNGPNNYLYIFHRIYGSIRTTISYGDVELNRFVMRMAQISGRHISILQPIKDIALPDGSRANLTLGTEVTKKGATFTIRKFKERPISPIELIEYNSVDPYLLAYLWTLLYFKRSILVSGGTASGKTTLMNVLCAFIKPENKIVSLEDTPELNLYHPNWIQSVTRSGFGGESGGAAPASGTSHQGGKTPGDISMYDLLAAALRQRPEYILVGEVRGAEAFTLFQAIAVGHAAMGTIHAGSMRELLSRVESNPMNVPRTLFASMDCVVFPAQVRRNDRNVRRVMQAVEILELDTDGDLVTNPVFRWDAFTDKFMFSGRSHIFEKIEAQLGIKQEEILKDVESRAAFLNDLRQRCIRDYYQVVEQIREYELNKISARQSQ